MGKVVIVVYRPKEGKEKELEKVVADHLRILGAQGLVTSREPMVMRAADGAIIEMFEWKSAEAIKAAHQNTEVQKLWERFAMVCDYEKPVNVKEFHNLFSEFEAIN